MTYKFNYAPKLATALSPFALLLASCGQAQSVDTASAASAEPQVAEKGTFNEPWAAAFIPGTDWLVVTEQAGKMIAYDTASGKRLEISGVPDVAYGGQGGLGDVAFVESEAAGNVSGRTIYLSWAEAGDGDTRGAVVGKGSLSCDSAACAVRGLEVIWRQAPKTTGRGHYSHRILISPDEQHLFIASGDRQKLTPAQDNSNTLGTIVRLNMDGSTAADNPMADKPAPTDQIWSYGHRNILGMDWDAEGRLWEIEHGPRGGDELNLVQPGVNYGWPTVSDGIHYNRDPIPDHETRPEFTPPVAGWTPVIAPGDMLIYRGEMFPAWKGDALVAGLGSSALVHVDLDGDTASEKGRMEIGGRLRAIAEASDGSLWVFEDGEQAKLFHLTAP